MDMVIVVVPIYREMTASEKLSFAQVQRVLHKYPLCFMAPERMRPFLEDKGYTVEFFPNNSMSSIVEYSRLLLTPEFYKRFTKYQYILLYQLDAFVFSDQLARFCAMDYDFIGAPIPFSFWGQNFKIKGMRVVENGGLSLRKTDSCLRMTLMRDVIYERTNRRYEFERAEDVFFSYCGNMKDIDFQIPNTVIASSFSTTFNVGHGLNRISYDNLPFGCHAWSKVGFFGFWRPYIDSFSEKKLLNDVVEEIYMNGSVDYRVQFFSPVIRYLISRIVREYKRNEIKKILCKYIIRQQKLLVVWGYGMVGKRCLELLSFAGIPVDFLFDKEAAGRCGGARLPVVLPDKEMIKSKKCIIIVSTTKYYKDVAEMLKKWELVEGKDFVSYRKLEQHLVFDYYLPIWERYTKACSANHSMSKGRENEKNNKKVEDDVFT